MSEVEEILHTLLNFRDPWSQLDEAKTKLTNLIAQEANKLAEAAIFVEPPAGVDETCNRLLKEAQRIKLRALTADKEDDLINFIDNPETINKAVEGSMDKRLKVLDDVDHTIKSKVTGDPGNREDRQLRKAVTEVLVKWHMPTRQAAISEIQALFQAREQQLLTELLKQVRPYLDKGHLVDALPVAVIERLQNKTNDGGQNGDSD